MQSALWLELENPFDNLIMLSGETFDRGWFNDVLGFDELAIETCEDVWVSKLCKMELGIRETKKDEKIGVTSSRKQFQNFR